MRDRKLVTGWGYMSLALLAFGGLGIEALLAFLIEPFLYGSQLGDWSTWQMIVHWIITCMIWGYMYYYIVRDAKNKLGFDIGKKGEPVKLWQWAVIVVAVVFMLVMSYLDWGRFKVFAELESNGPLRFIFQYIYYIFETGLFTLIIVFAQKAFEVWFRKENVPYGGIILALTWGLAHIFTKGSLSVGVLSAIAGFVFGVIYLLVNRDIKKSLVILFLVFVI